VTDPVTQFLAAWGAVVSTILGAVKVIEYRKDRPIVRIRIQSGMKEAPTTSVYGGATLLLVIVANAGRRPVSVTHVSLMPVRRGGTYILCADPVTAKYPVELTEGKGHTFILNEDTLKQREPRYSPENYVVVIDDAAGRRHWSHGPIRRWRRTGRLT
jgi:hypothetical protein